MSLQLKTYEEYKAAYQRSVEDPEGFWAEVASSFHWYKSWDKVLDWEFSSPDVKWFAGGKTNITYNALDRHLATRGDQVAILFEPNNPDTPAMPVAWLAGVKKPPGWPRYSACASRS